VKPRKESSIKIGAGGVEGTIGQPKPQSTSKNEEKKEEKTDA